MFCYVLGMFLLCFAMLCYFLLCPPRRGGPGRYWCCRAFRHAAGAPLKGLNPMNGQKKDYADMEKLARHSKNWKKKQKLWNFVRKNNIYISLPIYIYLFTREKYVFLMLSFFFLCFFWFSMVFVCSCTFPNSKNLGLGGAKNPGLGGAENPGHVVVNIFSRI